MIAFFPNIYPDELLYSQIARYYARSGYARYSYVVSDIYQNRTTVHPSVEFVNKYTEDAMEWITKTSHWENITEHHTMYPAYIRFLPLNRRKEAVQSVLSGNGNWKKHMCLPILNEKRFLRYCPECAKEDRKNYGETYWHREHQISRIRICTKHNCFLESSNIPIASKSSPGLYDAESNVPETLETRYCDNTREIEFTTYLVSVFHEPIETENDFSVGAFLHSKLNVAYKSDSGIVRHISVFYDDYKQFYLGMPLMTPSYMQKIFNGYVYDPYYVLQLAFFEKISVYDISHIPTDTHSTKLENFYKELSTQYDIDYSVISKIGNEIMKYAAVKSNDFRMSENRRSEYEKLDRKYLPEVKKTVKEIIQKNGRPEKISVTKVQRIMGLPQKQLNHLPRCKSYIKNHTETQEQFWAREVTWALMELKKANKQITISGIMKLTNMRKQNVESALPYLDDKSQTIVEDLF